MKPLGDWNTFVGSGRIEDYLQFKQQEAQEETKKSTEQTREGLYGGFSYGNGHDFEDRFHR